MTLEEIRDAARAKADEETTGYIDTPELTQYVNQGYFFVFSKICQRFQDYFIAPEASFFTVEGQQAYDLPQGLIKLVRVERRQQGSTSDNDWIVLRRTNISNDRLNDRYPVREEYWPRMGYFVAGNKLYLRPVPSQVYELRLWAVVKPADLALDDDEPVIPQIYHPLIAEYAAMQMLQKSGEGIYVERRDAFNTELSNLLETVDFRDQQSEQMVVTDSDSAYPEGYYGF